MFLTQTTQDFKNSPGAKEATTDAISVNGPSTSGTASDATNRNLLSTGPRRPRPASRSPSRRCTKAVAFFASLESALMWVVMRQAHFDNEPTIDTDILDALQRYCHHLDQTKADIAVLAERLESAIAGSKP